MNMSVFLILCHVRMSRRVGAPHWLDHEFCVYHWLRGRWQVLILLT